VWPGLIELTSVLFDKDLRINPVFEPLHVQTLIPELAVEGLVHSVQPRLSGIDVGCVDVGLRQPFQYCSGHEFRAVVGSEVLRRTVGANEPGEHIDHLPGANAACHVDGQALPGELVDYGQTLQLLSVRVSIKHEIVSPQISRARCRQRARTAARDPPSRPFSRYLQLTLPPQAMSSVGAHAVSLALQEDLDAAIAVPGILSRQLSHDDYSRRVTLDQTRLVAQC